MMLRMEAHVALIVRGSHGGQRLEDCKCDIQTCLMIGEALDARSSKDHLSKCLVECLINDLVLSRQHNDSGES